VNIENINRLIAALRSPKGVGFNLGTYVGEQTDKLPDQTGNNLPYVACLAGHAFMLHTGMPPGDAKEVDPDTIEEAAVAFLGVSRRQGWELFFDLPDEVVLETITVDQAVATLERLKATGEVRWEL